MVLSDSEVDAILKELDYDKEAAFVPYKRSFEKRAAKKASSPKFQSSFEFGLGLFRGEENPLNESYTDASQVLSLEQIETMREVQEEDRGAGCVTSFAARQDCDILSYGAPWNGGRLLPVFVPTGSGGSLPDPIKVGEGGDAI